MQPSRPPDRAAPDLDLLALAADGVEDSQQALQGKEQRHHGDTDQTSPMGETPQTSSEDVFSRCIARVYNHVNKQCERVGKLAEDLRDIARDIAVEASRNELPDIRAQNLDAYRQRIGTDVDILLEISDEIQYAVESLGSSSPVSRHPGDW
eukprot:jgi/Botrbrau1/5791/Bobra.0155s0014.1